MANAGYTVGTFLAVQLTQLLSQRRILLVYGVLLVIGSALAAAAVFIVGHVLQGLCTSLLLNAAVPLVTRAGCVTISPSCSLSPRARCRPEQPRCGRYPVGEWFADAPGYLLGQVGADLAPLVPRRSLPVETTVRLRQLTPHSTAVRAARAMLFHKRGCFRAWRRHVCRCVDSQTSATHHGASASEVSRTELIT
jgi:hypothetical protein